jgi:hypothetical protein
MDRRGSLRDNPFYVLGVKTTATRQEIEREGGKLLSMLELRLASVKTYSTPLGDAERTADKVRAAMSELRDPAKRLTHEIWARIDPKTEASEGRRRVEPEPWREAFAAMGWRHR